MHASSTLIFEFQSGGEATLIASLCKWFCKTVFDFKFRSIIYYFRKIYVYIWNNLKWDRCSVLEFRICFGITLYIEIDLLLIFNSWIENVISPYHFEGSNTSKSRSNILKLRNFKEYKMFDKDINLVWNVLKKNIVLNNSFQKGKLNISTRNR